MLLAVSEAKGIDSNCIPRIGTGLAGGVGLRGEVCGALIGGALILGLLYGTDLPDDEVKYATYVKTGEFVNRFAQANGAIHCRELIGIELTKDEDFQTYHSLNLKETVCSGAVSNAVYSLMDMLE